MEREIKTCAECGEFSDLRACGKYHSFIARLFGFIFRSDRAACIAQIKHLGLEGHTAAMAEKKAQTIRR